MTTSQLAAKLKVTCPTVFKALKNGSLPAKKIQVGKRFQWYIKLEDGIKWNEARKKNHLTVGTRKIIKYQFNLPSSLYQRIINIAEKTNKSRMHTILTAISEYAERNDNNEDLR